MRKLIFVAALLSAAIVPAFAAAQKYSGSISIHADDNFGAEEIYGSIESGKAKCERNRTVLLFYAAFSMGPSQFGQIDQTATNSSGEYSFFPQNDMAARGGGTFDGGRYFVRTPKKNAGNDVCVRDNSRIIVIEEFCQASAQDEAATKRGLC